MLSSSPALTPSSDAAKDDGSLGTFHRVQLLRQQLELQTQQTQFIVAQVQHLKDQLAAETAARIEAQVGKLIVCLIIAINIFVSKNHTCFKLCGQLS